MTRHGRLHGTLALALAAGAACTPGSGPEIVLAPDAASFVVSGLGAEDLESLRALGPEFDGWPRLFAVRVAEGGDDVPPVVGEYAVEGETLRFTPLFPLEPGLRYRAVFRRWLLLAEPASHEGLAGIPPEYLLSVQEIFALPREAREPSTVVTHVYPSSDVLPENQLKFYVHFSAPMFRGEAYEHLRLLDEDGNPVEEVFLELGEELWDRAGRRFTLFFDPGRVKRELRPREELGPPIRQGRSFTLLVDRGWRDAGGQPLRESHRKTFRVGPPDFLPPEPETWTLRAPAAGSRRPLVVDFPEPLDHALLRRLLWVSGPRDSGELEGKVRVAEGETRWEFTPADVWRAGRHELKVETTLEDLAGNTIGRPFEVDVFEKVRRRVEVATASVPFDVDG